MTVWIGLGPKDCALENVNDGASERVQRVEARC